MDIRVCIKLDSRCLWHKRIVQQLNSDIAKEKQRRQQQLFYILSQLFYSATQNLQNYPMSLFSEVIELVVQTFSAGEIIRQLALN